MKAEPGRGGKEKERDSLPTGIMHCTHVHNTLILYGYRKRKEIAYPSHEFNN